MTTCKEPNMSTTDEQAAPLSKWERGREYRMEIMWSLAKLGYASTRQLAAIVWSRCDTSTRKMAGRTIRWLLANKLVVERRDSVAGERMIALTRAGAEKVSEWGMPLPRDRVHARDWLRHAHAHRTAANSIYAAVAGARGELDVGWSELEIWAGRPPEELCRHPYRLNGQERVKIPDLLLHGTNGKLPIWVEVENSWRNADGLKEATAFIQAAYQVGKISNVAFIATSPMAKTIGNRVREQLEQQPISGDEWRLLEINQAILRHRFVTVLSLDTNMLTLTPLPF